VRNAAGWTQQAKLVASDGAAGDRFGNSVCHRRRPHRGRRVPLRRDRARQRRGVYVFERSGSAWSRGRQARTGIGADIGEGLGWSLALEGDTLVAGAADDHHSGGQFDGGAAYVFVDAGGTWSQEQRVIAGDGEAFDYFGHAVALAGDTLVVGAYSDNHASAANGGSAYVFQRSAAVWTLAQKIVPADNHSNDLFGFALALEGDVLVATAAGDSQAGLIAAGSALRVPARAGRVRRDSGALLARAAGRRRVRSVDGALRRRADRRRVLGEQQRGALHRRRLRLPADELGVRARARSARDAVADRRRVRLRRGHRRRARAGRRAVRRRVRRRCRTPAPSTPTSWSPRCRPTAPPKVNGLGCTPSIDWSGTPSLSNPAPFVIGASDVAQPQARPADVRLGRRRRAVRRRHAVHRRRDPAHAAQDSGGSASGDDCSGAYAFDFNAWMQSGSAPELQAGSQAFAQYWSRDPLSAPAVGLTNALHFHVQP
jgi:hypothetical protein